MLLYLLLRDIKTNNNNRVLEGSLKVLNEILKVE